MQKRGVEVSFKYVKIATILDNLDKKGIFDPLMPMLSIPFLDWFESYNWSEYSFLEFGSGNSSKFFADKVKNILSFETSEEYYNKVNSDKPDNLELKLISRHDIEFGNYDLQKFDMVLIDSNTNRNLSTRSLLNKIQPDIIILDNSEWYPKTCEFLYSKDYQEIPFWGIRVEDPDEKCTSVFLKSGYRLPEKKYDFYAIGSDPGASIHDGLTSIVE